MGGCSVDECTNEAARGGYCWGHMKRLQREQTVNGELRAKHASLLDRLAEAAIAYAEAESDEDYELARDRLRKAAAAYGHRGGEAIREAMARLKAQGVRLGPPRRVEPEVAVAMVRQCGSVREAAAALRVSDRTVRRAVRLAGQNGTLCPGGREGQ